MTPIGPLKTVDNLVATRQIPQGIKLLVLAPPSDRPGDRVINVHFVCRVWVTYEIPPDADRSATTYWVGRGDRQQFPLLKHFLRPVIDDDDAGAARC